MRLQSFAKLNLYLCVLKKRPDNYHNINTLFERISLHDTLILTPRRDNKINIKCNCPGVPSDKTNLAWRAARILQEDFGAKRGVDISIIKRIPVGAGLGGGSSNAASVLTGLNKLWGLKLSPRKLLKYARAIGSDVAFFIYDCPFAEGKGRGDRIKPLISLKKLRLWHVVVVPSVAVSTARIYRQLDSVKHRLTRPASDVKILLCALRKNRSFINAAALRNDLESVTTRLYPEVRCIKKELLRLGAKKVLMSGSGGSVFATTASKKEASVLAQRLRRKKRPWQVFISHTS